VFVSHPVHEFTVPVQLGHPDARYWRALSLSLNAAWFILSTRMRDAEQTQATVLLAWEADLLEALDAPDTDIDSLQAMLPTSGMSQDGPVCVTIKEIWDGFERGSTEEQCVVFIDSDGERRTGPFLEINPNAVRADLIACIGRGRQR
jgi:hypothetical protein